MNKFDIGSKVLCKKFKEDHPLNKLWTVIAFQINKTIDSITITYQCALDKKKQWFREDQLI